MVSVAPYADWIMIIMIIMKTKLGPDVPFLCKLNDHSRNVFLKFHQNRLSRHFFDNFTRKINVKTRFSLFWFLDQHRDFYQVLIINDRCQGPIFSQIGGVAKIDQNDVTLGLSRKVGMDQVSSFCVRFIGIIQWLSNSFRQIYWVAIFSITSHTWKKTPKITEFFT